MVALDMICTLRLKSYLVLHYESCSHAQNLKVTFMLGTGYIAGSLVCRVFDNTTQEVNISNSPVHH